MERSRLNFIVDTAMLIAMLGLIWTGILIWTILPPGIRGGHGMALWGLNRHEFGDIHMYLGIALLILTGLHLWLHWGWYACKLTEVIKTSDSKDVKKRKIHAMIIVFVVLVLTIATLFIAKLQVKTGVDDHEHGHGHQRRGQNVAN